MSENVDELESQFILRLPAEAARTLREAIRTESSLKDRFTIRIERDMRHGEVRVDNWVMRGKIVDLPTIVESLKTIDSKGFYKTADICQMLICKEEDDLDDDTPQKGKKLEKKYLWPHGITPPVKNVRKQRFRKTLRKKHQEAPEIEKEVKRLLSADNDAVSVRWEVINEKVKEEPPTIKEEPVQENLDEQDLFGGRISDSDEDESAEVLNVLDSDDNSQNNISGDLLAEIKSLSSEPKPVTEFRSDMFRDFHGRRY